MTEHVSIPTLLSSVNTFCELRDQEVGLDTSGNYNRNLWITLNVSFFEASGLPFDIMFSFLKEFLFSEIVYI